MSFTPSPPIARVSIPNRDFDELQRFIGGWLYPLSPNVSIPNRDFDELQPLGSGTLTIFSFQGTVARIDHQYTITAVGLKIGVRKKRLKPFKVKAFRDRADRYWAIRG
jgi:hypothetical protein